MTGAAIQSTFDAKTFLAREDAQAEKHEYIRGDVFAMVGARREHVVSGTERSLQANRNRV